MPVKMGLISTPPRQRMAARSMEIAAQKPSPPKTELDQLHEIGDRNFGSCPRIVEEAKIQQQNGATAGYRSIVCPKSDSMAEWGAQEAQPRLHSHHLQPSAPPQKFKKDSQVEAQSTQLQPQHCAGNFSAVTSNAAPIRNSLSALCFHATGRSKECIPLFCEHSWASRACFNHSIPSCATRRYYS